MICAGLILSETTIAGMRSKLSNKRRVANIVKDPSKTQYGDRRRLMSSLVGSSQRKADKWHAMLHIARGRGLGAPQRARSLVLGIIGGRIASLI